MVFESNKIPLALKYDSNGKIIGLRQASEIQVSSVSAINFSASVLDVAEFTVTELTVTTLNAANLSFTDLVVTGLTSISITSDSIRSPDISATNFAADSFNPTTLSVNYLSATVSISGAQIRSPDISATNFAAASFNPTTLLATYISATDSVSSAQIRSPDISATNFAAASFNPATLVADYISATNSVSSANIRSPSANIGTISGLNSLNILVKSNIDAEGNIVGATYLQTNNIQYKGTPPTDPEINFEAHLQLGANSLSGANVSAGTGKFPSLTGTTLNSTNATLTTAGGTNLNFTNVTGTTLNSTNATLTNVTGTAATITTIGGTNSTFTNVTGTNLNSTTANLTTLTAGSISATTTLSAIQLISPSISGTNVTGVNLLGTNVTGTTITTTTLRGTTLSGTNVTGVNLLGTNVTGTTFRSTNSTITNLTGTGATITTVGGTNSNFTNVTGTTFNSTNATITNLTGTVATIPTFNATLVKSTSVSSLNLSAFNVTGQTLNTWQIKMAQPTSVGGFTAPYSSLLLVSADTFQGNGYATTAGAINLPPLAGQDLLGARFVDCGGIFIGANIVEFGRRHPNNPIYAQAIGVPTESFSLTGNPPGDHTYLQVTSITGGGVTSPDTLVFHGGTNQEDYIVSRILYTVTGIAPILAVDSPTESEVFSTYNQNTLHSTFLAYNDLKYAVTGNLSIVGNIEGTGGIHAAGVSGNHVSGTSGTFANLYFTNASSNGGFISQVSGLTPTNSTHIATKGYVDTVSGTHVHDLTTTSITGILPISKGGTNANAFTDKAVIYYDSGGGGTLLDSGAPSNNTVLIGTAGAAPAFSNQFTVTGITATSALFTYLRSTFLSSNGGFTTTVSGITPTDSTHLTTKNYTDASYSTTAHTHSLDSASITGALPVSKGGTSNTSFTLGGLIYYDNDPIDILTTLSPGAANTILQGNAGIPVWTATPTVTTMKATTLSGTDVTGINLLGTNVTGTNITSTNVTGTNARLTNITVTGITTTGGFTTTVSGVTPTDSTHLATKNYIDNLAVSQNAIWDAKGDLAVGTGSNAASKLSVSSNNLVLAADSSTSTGLAYKAGAIRLFNSFDATEISSSTSESSALSFSIPAGTIGAADTVEINIEGYLLNNTAGSVTYTARAFWAGACIWGDVFGITNTSVKKPFWVTVRATNLGSVSKQRISGVIDVHNGTAAGSVTGIGNWGQTDPAMTFMSNGYPTTNTTSTAAVLTFSLQMATNDANARFKYDIVRVNLLKGLV